MKTLVSYYSKNGHSKKIAELLAQKLGAPIEEIRQLTSASKGNGFTQAIGAVFKKEAEIDTPINDPADFDHVVLVMPIWGGTLCPAMRAYVSRSRATIKSVSLVTLSKSSGAEKLSAELKNTYGLPPVHVLSIKEKDTLYNGHIDPLTELVEKIKSSSKA